MEGEKHSEVTKSSSVCNVNVNDMSKEVISNTESAKPHECKPHATNLLQNENVPLHKRRFDARHMDLPENLTLLQTPSSGDATDVSPGARSLTSPTSGEDWDLEDESSSGAPYSDNLSDRMIKRLEGKNDPLSKRSLEVALATHSTEEALDHLEKLYRLMDQLFALKEHNARVLRRARDLEHLKNLREMHKQIEKEMERTKNEGLELTIHNDAMNTDLEEEYGYTEALLDSMLAAGRSASLKRGGSKWKSASQGKFRQSILRKQRSRSMGGEALESCSVEQEHLTVPLKTRRYYDIKGDKKNISKWTKVKAAFKWEKAHTGVAIAGAGCLLGLSEEGFSRECPPTTPATPATPMSLTPTSSMDDLGVESGATGSRRSDISSIRPLEADGYLHAPTQEEGSISPSSSKLHKTPWGKMKDIIQTRKESVKRKQNRSSMKSFSDSQRYSENYSLSDGGFGCGGLSNYDSTEILNSRIPLRALSHYLEDDSGANSDPSCRLISDERKPPILTVTMPSSEELPRYVSSTQIVTKNGHDLIKSSSHSRVDTEPIHKPLRKQRSLELAPGGRPPVGRHRLDSGGDMSGSSPATGRRSSKWSKVKRAFLTSTSASVPSSPNRHSVFFGDYLETEAASSGCEGGPGAGAASSALPGTPVTSSASVLTASDGVVSSSVGVRDEIRRDYAALQSRLGRELSDRRAANADVQRGQMYAGSRPVATEEQLSAAFRKKLREWHRMKAVAARQPPPMPERADLSEDFLRKWDEWKRMKEAGMVPAWGDETPSTPAPTPALASPARHEVLVQTSTGFFRFHGISRSFTRKLHEWEKARGIAPEASTSALLRGALPAGAAPRTQDRLGAPLQRAQSAGSVRAGVEAGAAPAPSSTLRASSLSVNDVDRLERDLRDGSHDLSTQVSECESAGGGGGGEGDGALLVEVEAEEVETAAPLMAVTPRHQRQTPVYKYDDTEPRNLLLTGSSVCRAVCSSGWSRAVCGSGALGSEAWRAAALALLQGEAARAQLRRGRANVAQRADDVGAQLADIRMAQANKSSSYGQITGRLKELEKRLTRLGKESDILKNSLINRSQDFLTLALTFRSKIETVMTDEELEKRTEILDLLKDLHSKVQYICKVAEQRVKNPTDYELDTELTEDLKEVLRKIDKVETSCKTLNEEENGLCVEYTIQEPQFMQPNSSWNEENTDNSSDVMNSIPTTPILIKLDKTTVTQIKECPEPDTVKSNNNLASNKKSTDSLKLNEENADSLAVKKKDSFEKNSNKKQLKRAKRLERELSKHSETDTEADVDNVTIDIPRRKKLVRARRVSDTHGNTIQKQRSLEKATDSDSEENVIVLKLKPKKSDCSGKEDIITLKTMKRPMLQKMRSFEDTGSKDMISVKTLDKKTSSEYCMRFEPEEIEIEAEEERQSTPEVIVKTTRKIFSPVRRDSKGKPKAVIGFDLEEITSSIEKRRAESALASKFPIESQMPDIIGDEKTDSNSARSEGIIKSSESLSRKEPVKTLEGHRIRKSSSTSDSIGRGFPSSPLQARKLSSSSKVEGEELYGSGTISSIREVSPTRIDSESSLVRRGSSERYVHNPKMLRRSPSATGSPVLSRSNTSGVAAGSLPPLPSSPTPSRRDRPPTKETAPSIRIMIQRYNLKLNEEAAREVGSGSGSGPPSPWRSPVAERRRVPVSPDRYPEDVRRALQLGSVRNNPFFDKEVQKSASASQVPRRQQSSPGPRLKFTESPGVGRCKENESDQSSELTPISQKKLLLKGILKSSSVGSLKSSPVTARRVKNETNENENKTKDPRDLKPVSEKTNEKTEENKEQASIASVLKDKSLPSSTSSSVRSKTSKPNQEEKRSLIKAMTSGIRRKLSGDSPKTKSAPTTPLSTFADCPLDVAGCSHESNRALRLRLARERFLSSSEAGPSRGKDSCNSVGDLRVGNRLSQISCGSDTSYEANSLIAMPSHPDYKSALQKSISIGMINVDPRSYERIGADERCCVSLPRGETPNQRGPQKSSSRFSLSNLAAKFRKVKMRRGTKSKERDGPSAVSRLCRQSLLVNLGDQTSGESSGSRNVSRSISMPDASNKN